MQKFVNEYKYSTEVVVESARAWWDMKFKGILLAAVVLALCFGVISMAIESVACSIIALLFTLFVAFLWVKRKQTALSERNKMLQIFKKEYPKVKVVLGEDILVAFNKNERNFPYSEIKKVKSTKNLIVIVLKDDSSIVLAKDGFTIGTAKECVKFLSEKVR